MKKSLIICLSILSIIFIASTSTSDANMFNRFKKGFYFEKYKTAEEAKVELLKLHPIGSDVRELVKRLEMAGAMVKDKDLDNAHKFKQYDKWWMEGTVRMYTFQYDKASLPFVFINYLIWNGSIRVDEGNKIILMTARGSVSKNDWTEETVKQLASWKLKYHELIMNKKPNADVFIDDKAVNAVEWRKSLGTK